MNQPSQSGSVPSVEVLTNIQLNSVLSVLQALQPYLLLTQRELDAGIPKDLDGGLDAASLNTYVKACSRLDALLDDESRWSLQGAQSLYKAMQEHHESAARFNENQSKVLAELHRPSRRLQPKLATFGAEFVAYWGDALMPGGIVIGRGATPADAMLDFDAAFNRRPEAQLKFTPEAQQKLIARQLAAEIGPLPLPPKRAKKK